MIDAHTQLRITLKQHQHSVTPQRIHLFNLLQEHQPITMHELLLKIGTDIDKATVYRTISLFEKIGIIERIQVGWKYRLELGDAFQHHHHHLHCRSCGRIIAIPEDAVLEERLLTLAHTLHFKAETHQIEIHGICQDCMVS